MLPMFLFIFVQAVWCSYVWRRGWWWWRNGWRRPNTAETKGR